MLRREKVASEGKNLEAQDLYFALSGLSTF
jgi:hypothetical protein